MRNAKPSLLNSTSCCVTTFVFYLFRRFRWCCCGCYLIPCCHYCWCYCRDGGCKCWWWCWCRWSDSYNCLGFHLLLIFHTHTHRGTLCVFNSTHTERLYVYSTQQTKSDSMYIQLNYIHRVRVCFKDKDISSLCLSEIDIVRVFVCDR